jgi:hypothetical protein
MPESRGRKPKKPTKQTVAVTQTAKAAAVDSYIAAPQFTKTHGSKCNRIVQSSSKTGLWHTHGLRARLQALTRNPTANFSLSVSGLLIGLFTLGLIFAGPSLLGLLPGPKVFLDVNILQGKNRDTAGCVGYSLGIGVGGEPDEVIEQLHLTAQFPGNISNFTFGAIDTTIMSGGEHAGSVGMGLVQDKNGDCSAVEAFIHSDSDLKATKTGPRMVRIDGTNILTRTMADGVFAMSRKGSSFDPSFLTAGGFYKYEKFGYTVTKHFLEMPHNQPR